MGRHLSEARKINLIRCECLLCWKDKILKTILNGLAILDKRRINIYFIEEFVISMYLASYCLSIATVGYSNMHKTLLFLQVCDSTLWDKELFKLTGRRVSVLKGSIPSPDDEPIHPANSKVDVR